MEKLLLRNIDVPDSHTLAVYRSRGGYRSWEEVVKNIRPEQLIEEVKASGLRGRGGAGFPTGMKWSFVPKDSPKPRYMVCNADESEPGTFKDRPLMEKDPHSMIEGMLIASYAVKAATCYVYIRGEYWFIKDVVDEAIREAYAKGYLGKNILGTDFSCDM